MGIQFLYQTMRSQNASGNNHISSSTTNRLGQLVHPLRRAVHHFHCHVAREAELTAAPEGDRGLKRNVIFDLYVFENIPKSLARSGVDSRSTSGWRAPEIMVVISMSTLCCKPPPSSREILLQLKEVNVRV